mmetsp:Transcript_3630/g.9168  ORF Transcript_3630/g.9168 Transcript_3630/m.9168 type:complete len:246 (-) Transcript_3630:992-1729(-)
MAITASVKCSSAASRSPHVRWTWASCSHKSARRSCTEELLPGRATKISSAAVKASMAPSRSDAHHKILAYFVKHSTCKSVCLCSEPPGVVSCLRISSNLSAARSKLKTPERCSAEVRAAFICCSSSSCDRTAAGAWEMRLISSHSVTSCSSTSSSAVPSAATAGSASGVSAAADGSSMTSGSAASAVVGGKSFRTSFEPRARCCLPNLDCFAAGFTGAEKPPPTRLDVSLDTSVATSAPLPSWLA